MQRQVSGKSIPSNNTTGRIEDTAASLRLEPRVGCREEATQPLDRREAEQLKRDDMTPLPDEAIVVRGGLCLPENFEKGSGVALDATGQLDNVSVNAGAGLPLADLTKPNPQTGYPGIRNGQVGVTTVGAIRKLGGEVVPAPTRSNPHHACLRGLTPDQAARLFRPTVPNPNRSP